MGNRKNMMRRIKTALISVSDKSNLKILSATDLNDAAKKIVDAIK